MIEVGEFVRTKQGKIAHVYAYQDLTTYDDKGISVTFHSFDTDKGTIADVDIAKNSKNIIDLIEEGDYVNGCKVIRIFSNEITVVSDYGIQSYTFKEINANKHGSIIKSIVTHEQFKSIEYRLEDNKNEKI